MFKHLTDLTQQQVVAVCVQCMRESFFSPEQTLSLLCVQCMGRAVSARGGEDPEFVNQLHTNPSPKRRKINLLQAGGWGGTFCCPWGGAFMAQAQTHKMAKSPSTPCVSQLP